MSLDLYVPPSRDKDGNAIFRVITGADWKRSLDRAKTYRNAISDQIFIAIKEAIEDGRRRFPDVIGPFIPLQSNNTNPNPK